MSTKQWEKEKLVLINKDKGNLNSPSSYQPMCKLDTATKLLQKLLKPHLQLVMVIQAAGDLPSRQHGFCLLDKGCSTVDAVKEVVAAVDAITRESPLMNNSTTDHTKCVKGLYICQLEQHATGMKQV